MKNQTSTEQQLRTQTALPTQWSKPTLTATPLAHALSIGNINFGGFIPAIGCVS